MRLEPNLGFYLRVALLYPMMDKMIQWCVIRKHAPTRLVFEYTALVVMITLKLPLEDASGRIFVPRRGSSLALGSNRL